MKIFTFDDNFYALTSCIYTAWEYSLSHKDEEIMLQKHSILQQDMFSEFIYVKTNMENAKKVIRSIKSKLSFQTYQTVYMAFLHFKDTGNDIYRFLRPAFKYGRDINYMPGEEAVINIKKLEKSVRSELNSYLEITRFEETGEDSFIAKIEPRHNILAELSNHFKSRMPSLNWVIVDTSRSLALVHPMNGDCFLQALNKVELEGLLKTNDIKAPYKKLWKVFFNHISIKERENLKLQRQHCPLRKRKYMTEFMGL